MYRSEAAREGSDLLAEDGPDHVTYRGTTYEVEVGHERFDEPVYRPTAEPVSEDPERTEAILKATFVGARVSRADLSSEAHRIVVGARGEEYSETHPFSDPYQELLRAFDKRPYIDGNIRKDAGVSANREEMIQYEDTYYEYVLRFTGPNA